jgi:ABC-2 type transport system permease protein
VVRQVTGAWIVWELSWSIRQGTLSPRLLRPFHPLLESAVWILVAVPFRLLVLAPVLAAIVAWRPGLLAVPSPVAAAQLGVALALAWLLSYLVQCAFGLLAFWLDKSDGLFEMWMAAWGVLSGYVAPLAFFPETVRPVLRCLPFRAMLGLPVELLGGFVAPADAWVELAVGAAWTGVAWALVAVLWRRGLVRYGAFGA